jgi:parallel beta-helix repeat protein
MRSTLPLVIIAIILCVGSGLYAYQQDIDNNQSSSKQPKSVDYILYPNSGPSFISVLSAIQSRYDNNEKNNFVVGLTNGIYNQSVIYILIDNSSAFSELFIEFRGLGVSVQISGDNLLMADTGNLHFKFQNISITGGIRGIETYINPDSESLTFLEVNNCKIFGNAGTNYGFDVNMDGTGIYADGPATITGCEIYNNTGKNYWVSVNGVENFSRGGGIAVKNNSAFETIIENNNIHNNIAIAGGGIYATGTGQITIKDNLVHSNTRSIYLYTIYGTTWQLQGGAGEGIWGYDCDKLTLTGNIIRNQIPGTVGDRDDMPLSSASVIEYCGYSPTMISVVIENNSFMDNGNCHGIWVRMPSGRTLIRNNLSCSNKFGIYCSDYDNGLITMTYNDAYQNGTLNNEVINYFIETPNWITQSNNGEFDPLVSSSYAPLWTASVISPLIDAGYQRSYDPDGTPSDIGAIRAGDHKYEEYSMPGPSGIKWMSFPVLNGITNAYCMNGNFFSPIINPQWLQLIQYRPPNSPVKYIHWDGNNWTNLNDDVNSLQGYKINMYPAAPSNLEIKTTGYLQAPHTVIPLNQGENWLGYFQETSSKPLDALAPILNNISQIKTQNWTMVKVQGSWLHSSSWVINYGDLVIVTADQECSFSWNNAQPVNPKSVPKAKEFVYTEKLDYTPFYLTIPESKTTELPSEIGLYVNGICKGAAVVEEDLTHICAYLDAGEEITPENSNLVFYYSNKAIPNNKGIYKMAPGQVSKVKAATTYYTMKITDLDKVTPVPIEAILHQNYPNPFNPSTTIAYDLPEDGAVQISVYNIKGQLVQKLLDKPQGIGSHSVIWNGKDAAGSACASGVYYCKLTSKGKSITKKMLLMK